MRTRDMMAAAGLAAAGIACSGLAGAKAADAGVERGRYLAAVMDCGGCHTGGALMGRPDPARTLGGSEVGFEIPGLGVFWPPNLTPDPETGKASWTAEDFVRAITAGHRPDGRELAPAMPWRSYAALTPEDARDLAAYIRSLPPVRFATPGPVGPGETPPAPFLRMIVPR